MKRQTNKQTNKTHTRTKNTPCTWKHDDDDDDDEYDDDEYDDDKE